MNETYDMGSGDDNPDDLGSLWQTAADPAPTLPAERMVARWRLQLWLVTALEAALLIGLLIWTMVALKRRPSGLELVFWVNAWTLATVVLVYALWNRRGLWRPLGESTPRFLEHWRERCRRGLRTVTFVRAAVAFEVAFLVTLLVASGRGRPTSFLVLGTIALAYQLWSVLFERSCQRELTRIGKFEAELEKELEL